MHTSGLIRSRLLRLVILGCFTAFLACRSDLKDPGIEPDLAVTQLIITPSAATLDTNEFITLQSYGINVNGDSVAVAVNWTSKGGTLLGNGIFLSTKTGVFEVIGRAKDFPQVRDTAVITVSSGPVTLVDIVINPVGPILAPGETRPFLVESHFSDSTIVPGAPVNWSATGGTISASGDYTAGLTEGTFQVIATSQVSAIADTVALTINAIAPVVQSIVLAPDTVTVQPGGTTQFAAFANYSDGTFAPAAVQYTATAGTISPNGAYVASQVPGTYRVIAFHAATNKADTSNVTVVTSSLVHINLNPPTAAISTGSTQQYNVTGTFSDSSTSSVSVVFSATGGTISSGGLYTAGGTPGSFKVYATTASGLFADTASVTLNLANATLTSVRVTPATLSILVGATQQFGVVGIMSDGTQTNVSVNWTASGGTITPAGFYTAPQVAGTYRVIARTIVGSLADTTLVTVNPVVSLIKIDVAPATTSVLTGAIQQFTAVGKLSNGSNTAVSVNWTATGGTISNTGQYTAGNTIGNFRVIAVEQGGTLADTGDVAIVNLPPPGSPTCINEPPGLSVLFDQPWNAVPPIVPAKDQHGWDVRSQTEANKLAVTPDASAPRTQPNVLAGKFPGGTKGGAAPFRMNRQFGRNVTTIYGCLFTLLDPTFTNNGNVGTKFGYIVSPYFGGPSSLDAYLNLTNNLGVNIAGQGLNRNMLSSFSLVGHRGVWVKVEFLLISNTQGNADGVAKMWVNGAQVLNAANVQYFLPTQAPAWNLITWNPTYGGGVNPVPYTMFQYIDNWYLSVK